MSGRKALGRGLNILYGEDEQELQANVGGSAVRNIPSDLITVNPFQPRIDFSNDNIEELAKSIKELGLLQPVVVREVSKNKYQIISGERRFRALKSLGEENIPVIIRENVDDKEMLELALVENIQRENLNEIETALSYKKLSDECGYSHQEISDRLGKSRASVTNTLRLLKLPDSIQQMLRNQQLTPGHAKVLLGVENAVLQLAIAQEVVRNSLSVREVEKRISSATAPKSESSKTLPMGDDFLTNRYSSVLSGIKKAHGFSVKVVKKQGEKGKLEIDFANVEEFEKIIAILSKEDGE